METTGAEADVRTRHPALFAPARWEWGGMDVQFSTAPPPDALVTNIHVVCFTAAGRVVLCRDEQERVGHPHWFLPGGTRERGESVEECVRRELAEEAGASLAGPLTWIGAHRATADRPRPGYEWQPHPHRAWLWCTADVRVDGLPQPDGPGAEQVVEVREAEPADAVRLIGASEGPEFAELVSYACETRKSHM